MKTKSKLIFIYLATAITLLVALVAMMTFSAMLTRNDYSQPNEPKNGYLVHMMERGVYREQYMCAGDDCVLLRLPGITGFKPSRIQIGGENYETTSLAPYSISARGIYCLGRVSMETCLGLVVLEPQVGCPDSIVYLGFSALLVPESCVVEP